MLEAVYIHIPFCRDICSYCDFCKMYYNEKIVNLYLDALQNEIKEKYHGEKIKTLYIGGGTPSCLNQRQLKKLFSILKIFKIKENYEFTFECNINDIDEELLKTLKNNKVNRLSLGIETINKKFYKFLNRYNDENLLLKKVDLVKEYFNNINVDLMYAFTNETLEDLKKDLDFVKKINVQHISIYSLILEENTKLYIDKVKPISQDLEADMYYYIIDYLKKLGYEHYELSNFCKKGYESLHNLTYWNNNQYYGFGLSSSGYLDNIRYTNTRSINRYLQGSYILEQEVISKRIDMENEMILGLRKIKGINKKVFFDKYHFKVEDIFDIMNLVKKNLIKDNDGYLYIPEDKLYLSNSILINFIGGSNE